jgi:hypothetical protein
MIPQCSGDSPLGQLVMPKYTNPIEQLLRILAAMGQAADQVAELLRAAGCRGFRNGGFPSPVFRYVYRKFDEGNLILVYSRPGKPSKIYLYLGDGKREEILLPPAIAEFLDNFDQGSYPDLDLGLSRGVG